MIFCFFPTSILPLLHFEILKNFLFFIQHYLLKSIVYVYYTIVNVEDVYEPTIAQVPDVWLSGELWLTESTLFVKEYNAKIRRHMNLPNCAYSRYSFVREGSDEVVDRIQATHIYGDQDSFSFIDLNPDTCLEALEYAEQHRDEYEC